jgi:hypothetical protein
MAPLAPVLDDAFMSRMPNAQSRKLARLLALACIAFGPLLSAAAPAAEPRTVPVVPSERDRAVPSPITDRFHVRGTYFQGDNVTDIRLDPTTQLPGTELSGEDDLNLDDQVNQGRIELMFRLRSRNRIRIDWLKLDRYGEAVLNRQVVFGDEEFDVNDFVVSRMDLRMLTFAYTRSLIRRDRFELGVGFGIHLTETEASGAVPAEFEREEVSQSGAFPTAGLDATWRITRRFALSARGQYFSWDDEDFDGSWQEYHADLQFRLRPNVAVGLGYTTIAMDLLVDDSDQPGRFDLSTRGPEIFFRVSY